jgi:hypothetical protein
MSSDTSSISNQDLAKKAFFFLKHHTCCKRHWGRRPTELAVYNEDALPDSELTYALREIELEKCCCRCRHSMRFLCRQMMDNGEFKADTKYNREWLVGLIHEFGGTV